MTTYNLISNKYQSTGKWVIDEYLSRDDAQAHLDRIAAAREKDGYNVDYLDSGVMSIYWKNSRPLVTT